MDPAEDGKAADPRDSGTRPEADLAIWKAPVAKPIARPSLPLRLALELYGRGGISVEILNDLKRTITERGNREGYGFVFEYRHGELNVGLESATVPPNALGNDPAGRFESDIAALLSCLPGNFVGSMKASITVKSQDHQIRSNFKLGKNRTISKTTTVEVPTVRGCSNDRPKRKLWDDPRITIPVMIIVGIVLVVLYSLGLIHLR